MPRLVEQLVLPYVGEMLKTAWDPIDPAQTNQVRCDVMRLYAWGVWSKTACGE